MRPVSPLQLTSANMAPPTARFLLLGAVACALWAHARAQPDSYTISTVAGGGIDDGLPATSVGMAVDAIAVDGAGNVLIADSNSLRVRRIAAGTRVVTTLAGNGGIAGFDSGDGGLAASAAIAPSAVAFIAGSVIIADCGGGCRIRRVTIGTGVIAAFAGNGLPASAVTAAMRRTRAWVTSEDSRWTPVVLCSLPTSAITASGELQRTRALLPLLWEAAQLGITAAASMATEGLPRAHG